MHAGVAREDYLDCRAIEHSISRSQGRGVVCLVGVRTTRLPEESKGSGLLGYTVTPLECWKVSDLLYENGSVSQGCPSSAETRADTMKTYPWRTIPAIWRSSRHTHLWIDGWRGSWAVRSTSWSRVVLGATPTKTDARVADRVALHLVDGHLGRMTLNELNKATPLSWGDLDVGDFAKTLEERAELILGHVAGKATDKYGGVVGVGELIHWLLWCSIVANWLGWAHSAVHGHRTAARHAYGTRGAVVGSLVLAAVLRCGGGDTHWAVATVYALHFAQSTLLVALVAKTDESVAARGTTDRIGHDLGRLARPKAVLEERDEYELVDLRPEIANKDGVFRTTLVTASGRGQ